MDEVGDRARGQADCPVALAVGWVEVLEGNRGLRG